MYHYTRDKDGTDETFDIYQGDQLLASIPFWEAAEEAEGTARLIVDALNAYKPSLFETVKDIVREHDNAMIFNVKTLA